MGNQIWFPTLTTSTEPQLLQTRDMVWKRTNRTAGWRDIPREYKPERMGQKAEEHALHAEILDSLRSQTLRDPLGTKESEPNKEMQPKLWPCHPHPLCFIFQSSFYSLVHICQVHFGPQPLPMISSIPGQSFTPPWLESSSHQLSTKCPLPGPFWWSPEAHGRSTVTKLFHPPYMAPILWPLFPWPTRPWTLMNLWVRNQGRKCIPWSQEGHKRICREMLSIWGIFGVSKPQVEPRGEERLRAVLSADQAGPWRNRPQSPPRNQALGGGRGEFRPEQGSASSPVLGNFPLLTQRTKAQSQRKWLTDDHRDPQNCHIHN